MNELPKFNSSEQEAKNLLLKSLEKLGAKIESDIVEGTFRVSFSFEEGEVTTIRIVFGDYSGADLVITNITTLPKEVMGKGYGSRAVQIILNWARQNNMKDIRAVQIQGDSERFWIKNGFKKMEKPNECNDFKIKK